MPTRLLSHSLIALAATALAGCIFVTPPTGLRVGDHSGEFANVPTTSATEVEFQVYDATDFAMIYPTAWTLSPQKDVPAGTKATLRASAGQRAASGEAEGITVTTFNEPLDPDPPTANVRLAQIVKSSLQSGHSEFTVLAEQPASLSGVNGYLIEATGKSGEITSHYMARSAMFDDKGYIVVISTTEDRFATYKPLFDHLFANFKLKDPDAPQPPASGVPPVGDQTATPEAQASP